MVGSAYKYIHCDLMNVLRYFTIILTMGFTFFSTFFILLNTWHILKFQNLERCSRTSLKKESRILCWRLKHSKWYKILSLFLSTSNLWVYTYHNFELRSQKGYWWIRYHWYGILQKIYVKSFIFWCSMVWRLKIFKC